MIPSTKPSKSGPRDSNTSNKSTNYTPSTNPSFCYLEDNEKIIETSNQSTPVSSYNSNNKNHSYNSQNDLINHHHSHNKDNIFKKAKRIEENNSSSKDPIIRRDTNDQYYLPYNDSSKHHKEYPVYNQRNYRPHPRDSIQYQSSKGTLHTVSSNSIHNIATNT
eukprot:UN24727